MSAPDPMKPGFTVQQFHPDNLALQVAAEAERRAAEAEVKPASKRPRKVAA
jgi:hypothetical protein